MSEDQLRQAIVDQEHLKLLTIGYLVSAGTNAFFSLFGLLYAFMGVVITAAISRAPARPGQDAPPEFVGWIFGLFGFGFFAILAGLGVLKFLVARRLKQRRSRTFCMVVAGVSCFGVPYGTMLGVFTFLVLSRPSVARLFQAESINSERSE
ncbi:MAG TPA: hypothetical protein VGL91_02750 [Acidobacteriota bacterium]|jgi:hypothetical protein